MAEPVRMHTGLRDYLRVVRRRKATIALAVIFAVSLSLVVSSFQTPVYSASSEVLRQQKSTESLFDPSTGQFIDPVRALQTQIRVLQSPQIRNAAREKLGYSAEIDATPIGQTDVIMIRAESTDPDRAAAIANAYADVYIEYRRKKAVDEVLSAAVEVEHKTNELQQRIEAASGALRDSLVQQQALFSSTHDELQVAASLQSGGAELVAAADVPESPVRPKPMQSAAVALFIGLFLGVGAAFFKEHLDDSVRTKEDLERAAPSISVMSMIPAVGKWRAEEAPQVISLLDPNAPATEAYRTLRTSIQFLGVDEPIRALQVTSPNAQEGKTTTLANLAVALARAGTRVVVVCCDLRRPRVHDFFGVDNQLGFTSVLVGEATLQQALQPVPGVDRLYLLASGPLPPNPSELLQSKRAAELLSELQASSFVLLDSPPVLPVTDSLVLSKRVQGTLLVCAAGRTGRKELGRAIEMLRQVDASIIGTVLNGVTAETSYGYTYGNYGSRTFATNGNGSITNGREAPTRHRRSPTGKR